jgi:Leucine-rich repeat (LRR) protein
MFGVSSTQLQQNLRTTKKSPSALKNLLNSKNLNLEYNLLVSIPKSLFSSNLKLEFINLNGNELSKIFSRLGNLKTLLIEKNECVDEAYEHQMFFFL